MRFPMTKVRKSTALYTLALSLCATFALSVGVMPARAQSTPQAAYGAAIANARPPATCNAQATQASILACRAQLLATGGKIMLPAGTITLTSSLPVDSNIWYVGNQPNGIPQSVDPGDHWTPDGVKGTMLLCGGAGGFPMIAGKNTPLGSPDDGTTAIYNFGLENITLNANSSCTYGVQIGAANSFGILHSHLYNVWVSGATQWAFDIENTAFDDVQNLYMLNNANCFHWVDSQPTSQYNPSNSDIKRLFCYSTGNHMRGVVFEDTNSTAIMGSIRATQIQVNDFANSLVTEAATMSNGSTSIGVTDLSQYDVGMPVSVSASVNGFIQNEIYFVLSMSGTTGSGTITLSSSRIGSAISATGGTAVNIVTYGWPALEVVGMGGASQIGTMELTSLDLEGRSSCTIYLETTTAVWLQGTAMNPTAFAHVCARNSGSTRLDFSNGAALVYDLGGTTGTSTTIAGAAGTPIQNNGIGIWRDNALALNKMSISGRDSGGKGDLESVPLSNGSYLHPANAPIGQFTSFNTGTSLTLNAGNAGLMVYSGSTAGTYTLPVLSDSARNSTLMGIPYWIMNPTANALTVNSQSSQYFNGISGKSSLTIKPGQMVLLWGAKNSSGTFQWASAIARDAMTSSAAPSLGAGCGTGATISGSDGNGTITAGTSPGSCAVSFTATWPTAPHCVVTDEAGAVPAYSESTTALTITPTASHVYDYACAA